MFGLPRPQDISVRGQSEVLAVVALVVLTVLLAAVIGSALLDIDGQEPRYVALEADLTPGGVEITHDGGDVLSPEELVVRIEGDSIRREQSLAEFEVAPSDRFEAGDRATDSTEALLGPGPLTGEYRVMIVHEPTNTLLVDEMHSVAPAEALPFTVELSDAGDEKSGQVSVDLATMSAFGTVGPGDSAGNIASTAGTDQTVKTVVDFDWPAPNCPDGAVGELATHFSGNLSVSDGGFHVGDGDDVDETPPDGGCVLRSVAEQNESVEIVSMPGSEQEPLDYYPERGDTIRFNYSVHDPHPSGGTPPGEEPPADPERPDFEFRFGVQDAENYYFVRIAGGPLTQPYELVLGEVVDGENDTLATESIPGTLVGGTYQPVEIAWGTAENYDRIEVTFDGNKTASANSTTYDGGGIGFMQTGVEGPPGQGSPDASSGQGPPGEDSAFTTLVDRVEVVVGAPELQLQSIDAPDVISADGALAIDYTVENVGDKTGTESAVNLLVEGSIEDTDANVTVQPDDPVSGTLVFEDVEAFMSSVS